MSQQSHRWSTPSLILGASIVLLILLSVMVYLYPSGNNSNILKTGINELRTKIEAYHRSEDIASEQVYKNLLEKLDQVEKVVNEKNPEKTVGSLYELLKYVSENKGKLISYWAAEDLQLLINNLIFNVAKHL